MLTARSLLNGQEDFCTFQIVLPKPFYAISLVWNIIRKYVPESISTQVKGMRAFQNMTGCCFDVPDNMAARFEDIFTHEAEERGIDFTINRAKELPELKEDDTQGGYGAQRGGQGSWGGQSQGGRFQGNQRQGGYGGQSQGYGNQRQGGYGGQSQGYGGQSQGYGGQSQGGYGAQAQGGNGYNTRSQDNGYGAPPRNGGGAGGAGGAGGHSSGENSVFMGNLGEADQRQVESMFSAENLKPLRIRVLTDDTGRSKGAAFVDFASAGEATAACRLDGKEMANSHRRLRINPANSKPGPR